MRRIGYVVLLGALSAASCTNQKSAAKPVVPVTAPSVVVAAPSPTPIPLSAIAPPMPAAPSRSYGTIVPIKDYLEWLENFDGERLRAVALANANTKRVLVQYAVDTRSQKLGLPHDPAMPTMTEVTQAQKETVAVVQRIAESFAQRTPPPECATLAQIYGSSLSKTAVALDATVNQAAAEVAAIQQGNDDAGAGAGAEARLHAVGADNGKAEIDQANAELDRIFNNYPSLQKRFHVRW